MQKNTCFWKNTTVSGGLTYGYDFEDHLTSRNGSPALTYISDHDGNRVRKTAATTTYYLVDELNPTDPGRVKASLSKERDVIVSSLRKNRFPPGELELGRDWSKATQRERDQAADDLTAAFERVVRVWDQKDAEAQIKKECDDIPARSKGMMPALTKARSSCTSLMADLAGAKKRLE